MEIDKNKNEFNYHIYTQSTYNDGDWWKQKRTDRLSCNIAMQIF